LEDILNNVEEKLKDSHYQIESFFLFSLFLFKNPHLKLKVVNKQRDKKNRGTLSKNNQDIFILQIRLIDIKQVYALLVSVYLEKKNSYLTSEGKIKSLKIFKDKMTFVQSIPLTHIQPLNYLYTSELLCLNTKELTLNFFIEIAIKDPQKKIYNINLLRNLFGACI